MIHATFIRRKGNLESVELTGHAGSGEYGFVNSLEVLADCKADLAIDEIDGGYMKIDISHITRKTDEKVQLLFGSFLLGMTNLAENSQEFVSVQVIAN